MCVCLCVGDRVDVRRCACVTSRDTSLPTREATLQEVCPEACVYVNWERARQSKSKRAEEGEGKWKISIFNRHRHAQITVADKNESNNLLLRYWSLSSAQLYLRSSRLTSPSSPCTSCVQHLETKNNFVCNLILRAVIKQSKMHSIQNRLATTCNLQLARWRCCRMYLIPKRRFANKKLKIRHCIRFCRGRWRSGSVQFMAYAFILSMFDEECLCYISLSVSFEGLFKLVSC